MLQLKLDQVERKFHFPLPRLALHLHSYLGSLVLDYLLFNCNNYVYLDQQLHLLWNHQLVVAFSWCACGEEPPDKSWRLLLALGNRRELFLVFHGLHCLSPSAFLGNSSSRLDLLGILPVMFGHSVANSHGIDLDDCSSSAEILGQLVHEQHSLDPRVHPRAHLVWPGQQRGECEEWPRCDHAFRCCQLYLSLPGTDQVAQEKPFV